MIAMLLAEVLREMGHEVCATAATEDAAVAAAVRHKPDLMIVDDGCARAAASRPSREINRSGYIPHVFVTGESLRDQSLSPGTIVIQKPFTISELVWGFKARWPSRISAGRPASCMKTQKAGVIINSR